ncbi:hypothetical protein BDK51DRAFT_47036 [Blyttiomyces helicus]|uniref:Gamma-glutamylcyclotransferase n=1 Tax=Blyttiomyces helicus TaxID=388810 RepID=A0A4P9VWY0_9FUNG|nr:hypothetical protein BDK51DRAFT_47036 [Blyttiomyces helicus]|eukprot:RKO83203.1 hypothetical protein BDK51DRAFT_47036 [Blyttiomyces helicus]
MRQQMGTVESLNNREAGNWRSSFNDGRDCMRDELHRTKKAESTDSFLSPPAPNPTISLSTSTDAPVPSQLDEPLWVFGCGSLLFKVDFPFSQRVPVFVRGYVHPPLMAGGPGRVVTQLPTPECAACLEALGIPEDFVKVC